MADIRLGVSIAPDQAGLRRLQQEIARAVSNINPQLNIDTRQLRGLSSSQITNVARGFTDASRAAEGATRNITSFRRTIRRSTPTVDRLRASLSAGNQAAFDFGVRTARAARRLLEWAAPAQLVFLTISRLREAVNTLIELDTQARRLTFFAPDSPLAVAANESANFSRITQVNSRNLQGFLNIARQTGIAVNDVAEAFVTATRVGVQVGDTLEQAALGATKLSRGFETTVLQLVRLEAGALSAEQAVRRLRAIQAQFFDTLNLSSSAVDQAVANIGDALAVASANSTANVDELSNSLARLGSSLQGFQDANPISIIEILGQAFRTTGAEVGRLSTTFRQLTSLTVQNAEEIRQAFGVEILDQQTGQQTFQGLIDFLERINELSQVDRGQAFDLARLGTDRRNVNEVLQLAGAIGQLRGGFDALSSEQAQLERVGDNAVRTFLAEQNASDGLQASINRLEAAFTNLTGTIAGGGALTSLINTTTSVVNGVNSIVDAIQSSQPAFAAFLTFITATVVPRVASAFLGLGVSIRAALSGSNLTTRINSDLEKTSTAIEGIDRARRGGLITSVQQAQLTRQQVTSTQAIVVAQDRLRTIQIQLLLEKQREVVDESRIRDLKQEQLRLQDRLVLATKQEELSRRNIANTVSTGDRGRGIGARLGRSSAAIGAIGSAAAFAGSLVASNIAEGIREEGDTALAAGIQSGITGALAGGTIGAQIGSLIAPGIGTVIGGLLGGGTGAAIAGLSAASSEEERVSRDRSRNQEAEERRLAAISAQRAIINARAARQNDLAEQRTRAEQRIVRLQQDIATQQLRVQAAEGNRISQAEALTELNRLQVRLERAKGDLQREQLAIQARQLAAAAELSRIRRDEQEALSRINVIQNAAIQNLSDEQVIRVRIQFNQRSVNEQVRAIRRQIELERSRQQDIDIRVDARALERSRQRVLDLESRERQLRFQQVQREIQLRRQLQDRQSRLVEQQVQALNRVNSDYVRALDRAFQSQLRIAGFLNRAGNLVAQAISQRGEDFLNRLEAQGQVVSVQLRALESQTARQLAVLRRNQSQTLEQLNTGVTPFGSIADIDAALGTVTNVITQAARRTRDQIFNNLTGQFDRELLILRERERLERSNFQQRLAQTREEIRLRQDILSQEQQILRERINAERQLRSLRVEQQREFGRILLQGPEEFNKAIQSLQQSRAFFSGIQSTGAGDVTRNQILEIAQRAVRLRDLGQFDILRDVQSGLQRAIATGQPSTVGGLTNEELLRIFEQVVASGIPGGTSPEDVAFQFERQREELERQTAEQKAVKERQRQLELLAIRQAQLQEAQFRFDQASINAAQLQREQIISQAQLRLRELIAIRQALTGVTGGISTRIDTSSQSNITSSIIRGLSQAGLSPSPAQIGGREASGLARIISVLTRGGGAGGGRAPQVAPQDDVSRFPELRRQFATARDAQRQVRNREQDRVRAQFAQDLERLNRQEIVERRRIRDRIITDLQFNNQGRPVSPGRVGAGIEAAAPEFERVTRNFAQRRSELLEQERAKVNELADAFDRAIDAIASQFPREAIRLETRARGISNSFQKLEQALIRRQKQEDEEQRRARRFVGLRPGLRPPDVGRTDEIPGIRRNVPFNRVIQEFLQGLTVRGGTRGVTFEPAELRLLRQAIREQGGDATPRQQRRVRELERQVESFGRAIPSRRAASFFLDDSRRRRGAEVGFRELLQGDTGFVRQLRDLTQTSRGSRVGSRGRRELDVGQFRELLEDAGLSNVARGVTSQRDAANLANELLKLSRGLERNQGALGREQLRLIERLLGRELKENIENVNRRFTEQFERLVGQIGGRGQNESPQDFRERRVREERQAAVAAAEAAVRGLPEGIFREATTELARVFAENDKNRNEQLKESIANALENVSVKVEGEAEVTINTQVENRIKADQSFINSIRQVIPNISQRQLDALVETVTVLVRAERGRGTPLPASVGAFGSSNGGE